MYSIHFYQTEENKGLSDLTGLTMHEALAYSCSRACVVMFQGMIVSRDYLKNVVIAEVKDKITHGSGIDATWSFEFVGSKLVCKNSYHAMDANGMYAGWIDFQATIAYGEKSGKFGVIETDVTCDDDMIESILSEYEPDDDEIDLYDEDMDAYDNAPYLDDMPEFLWMQIFDANMIGLTIV